MIVRETEFRNAFYFLKRLSKSPLSPSYTRGYSAGNGDKEPAQKIYDYILLLGNEPKKSFEERIRLLDAFLEKQEEEERKLPFMGSSLYNSLRSYIKVSIDNINNGNPVQKKRM